MVGGSSNGHQHRCPGSLLTSGRARHYPRSHSARDLQSMKRSAVPSPYPSTHPSIHPSTRLRAKLFSPARRFRIGQIEGIWDNFVPPIQGGVFRGEDADDGESGRRNSNAQAPDDVAPQVARGWKVDAPSDSYAATAIQENLEADLARYPSIDCRSRAECDLG
jgi:hypothetical protein